MPKTSVRWTDKEQLTLDLPEHWQVLGRYSPRETSPIADVRAELARSLEKPTGRPAFSKLLSRAAKITLVIDDLTRVTPVQELMTPIVAALDKAGIEDHQVTGAVANGLHPTLTEEQLLSKVGSEFARRFKWVQNDCRCLDKYSRLGRLNPADFQHDKPSASAARSTDKGFDIYVLKELAEADLVVLLNSISPHVQAGFGGGLKLVLPGCAHAQTIGPLHKVGLDGNVERLVGQHPRHNLMRRAVEQAGKLFGKRVFSISTLLDSAGRVSDLGLGDPQQVQEQLSLTCEHKCGLEADNTADVAIVSAFPRDYDLLQGFKCVVNNRMAARPRGVLIGMMNLRSIGHLKLKMPFTLPTALLQMFLRMIDIGTASRLLGKLDKGLDPEAKFFMRLAMETISRNRVLLYCPELVKAGMQFPYTEAFDNQKALWKRADSLLGKPKRVRVNVFTVGGTTYPKLTPGFVTVP